MPDLFALVAPGIFLSNRAVRILLAIGLLLSSLPFLRAETAPGSLPLDPDDVPAIRKLSPSDYLTNNILIKFSHRGKVIIRVESALPDKHEYEVAGDNEQVTLTTFLGKKAEYQEMEFYVKGKAGAIRSYFFVGPKVDRWRSEFQDDVYTLTGTSSWNPKKVICRFQVLLKDR